MLISKNQSHIPTFTQLPRGETVEMFAKTCTYSLCMQSDRAEKSQYGSHHAKHGQRLYKPNIPLVLQPLLLPMEDEIMWC